MALTPKQGEYFCGRRLFSDSSWARKEKENLLKTYIDGVHPAVLGQKPV